jgi:hypothetical protein
MHREALCRFVSNCVIFCPVEAITGMKTMKQLKQRFIPEYPAFLPLTLR